MPDAPGLELILSDINAETPGAVLDTSFDREQAALIIDPDYLPGEPRFAVHYEMLNRERYERLRVKAVLPDPAAGDSDPDSLPHLDSCVGLFPTAEFQEREVYDFFGIVFNGHPDLRRILMPDDYVGWPQRRDFPVGGEPVIFTRDEVTNPGWWQ